MENNPPRVGKFKEMIVCKSDGSGAYRCDFCKRGFSNAQALGGHMNVHRKDRAKLRQYHHPEDDDHHLLLSPDMAAIRKNHPFIHLPRPSPDKLLILPQLDQSTEDDKDCTLKRQLNLSLFSDQKPSQSSSDNSDQRARCRAAAGGGRDDHHRGSSQKELDLELRLGLQPPHKTSASGSRYDFL